MALENDKGICPRYLPAENILTYDTYLFFFQKHDLIFKQKDILSHLPQKVKKYAVSFQEGKIFKHMLIFRYVSKYS